MTEKSLYLSHRKSALDRQWPNQKYLNIFFVHNKESSKMSVIAANEGIVCSGVMKKRLALVDTFNKTTMESAQVPI